MALMSVLFFAVITLELFVNNYNQLPTQSAAGNCYSSNPPGHQLYWVHNLVAVIYDSAATAIASYFLFLPRLGLISGFARMIFRDGILYFIVLTGANILNLIMFLSPDPATQPSCVSLLIAATQVMAERIILNMQAVSSDGSSNRPPAAIPETEASDIDTMRPRRQKFGAKPIRNGATGTISTTIPMFATSASYAQGLDFGAAIVKGDNKKGPPSIDSSYLEDWGRK